MNTRRIESWKRRYGALRPWTRHDVVLIIAGISLMVWGTTFDYYAQGGDRWNALIVARNVMSLHYWSYMFVAVGALVAASARWPTGRQMWGYTILTGVTLGWSGFYFLGMGMVPEPMSNAVFGLYWLLQAAVWWAISGLVNPGTVRHGRG